MVNLLSIRTPGISSVNMLQHICCMSFLLPGWRILYLSNYINKRSTMKFLSTNFSRPWGPSKWQHNPLIYQLLLIFLSSYEGWAHFHHSDHSSSCWTVLALVLTLHHSDWLCNELYGADHSLLIKGTFQTIFSRLTVHVSSLHFVVLSVGMLWGVTKFSLKSG